jgi:2,4-dienoyl-CoA reductase-like NADH-dependent reductase (Old Yellow Enzyme family)
VGSLFSSIVVGGVEVPNRIVMPPMTTRLAGDEGHVTDDLVASYKARALGGVGQFTVEMGSPERVGRHRFRELGVFRTEDCAEGIRAFFEKREPRFEGAPETGDEVEV